MNSNHRPSRGEQLDAVADVLAMVTGTLDGDPRAVIAIRKASPLSVDDLLATATGLLASVIAEQARIVGKTPLEYAKVLGLIHATRSLDDE